MGITDFAVNEVRLVNQGEFTQIPNNRLAGEALTDGQFVFLSTSEGRYLKASEDVQSTHLVIKSAKPRITASDIANLIKTIPTDEPVLAVTGLGVATIPYGSDVTEGDQLMIDANGFAVPWTADSGATGAYVVGYALETVDGTTTGTTGNTWGDAMLHLPAQFSQAP